MADSVKVGDRVQIRASGMDVTNGVTAKAGSMYGEGGPLWATVTNIVEEWSTGGKFGLPQKVTKVVCSNSGVVVWQVQPQDIASNVHKTDETKVEVPPEEPQPPAPTKSGEEKMKSAATKMLELAAAAMKEAQKNGTTAGGKGGGAYAPSKKSSNWAKGGKSTAGKSSKETKVSWPKTAKISSSMFSGDADRSTPTYQQVSVKPSKYATTPHNMKRYPVYQAKHKTSWQESGRKKEMLNGDKTLIQNGNNYPVLLQGPSGSNAAKYDYRFIPNDPRLKSGPAKSLEELLTKVHMQYGIQVHGNPDLERNVKYYMYNRFKTPDLGLAHNRTFTHVFFTRPDLYLMDDASHVADQVSKQSEVQMIYRRHPDLIRLLCDGEKMEDGNNFNMLLSNQCTSFQLTSEGLNKLEVGKSWNDHKMVYGDGYTGRFAGEFSCTFNETNDYSIINLIKLWITYIDNVSRGAMVPFYGPKEGETYPLTIPGKHCHVHDKALDYAASAYVFKVGPDGEDVLYWTKYYGIFPLTTGASALGFDMGGDQGTPKLDISFAYSFKQDLSPIALMEFNQAAGITGGVTWDQSYDHFLPGSARPLVGAPYIELIEKEPTMAKGNNHVYSSGKDIESIRLKFRKDTASVRSDTNLFKSK